MCAKLKKEIRQKLKRIVDDGPINPEALSHIGRVFGTIYSNSVLFVDRNSLFESKQKKVIEQAKTHGRIRCCMMTGWPNGTECRTELSRNHGMSCSDCRAGSAQSSSPAVRIDQGIFIECAPPMPAAPPKPMSAKWRGS